MPGNDSKQMKNVRGKKKTSEFYDDFYRYKS